MDILTKSIKKNLPITVKKEIFFWFHTLKYSKFHEHSLYWTFVSGFSRLEDLAYLLETTVVQKVLSILIYRDTMNIENTSWTYCISELPEKKSYILLTPIFIAFLPFDRLGVLARKFAKIVIVVLFNPRQCQLLGILSVPKFTANLYCIWLSIDLRYT